MSCPQDTVMGEVSAVAAALNKKAASKKEAEKEKVPTEILKQQKF